MQARTVLLRFAASASEISANSMDLPLQSQSETCFVTGAAFQAGDRVVSFLARDAAGEYRRWDCIAAAEGATLPEGEVLCRWTRVFKPPQPEANPERALRMTAEALFLSLTVDGTGGVEENGPLKQFLALMLERKRVVKNRGLSAGGTVVLYEHMSSRRMAEVPAGEMDAAFFAGIRDKLGGLLGESPAATVPAPPKLTAPPAP
jgi:hypothetical protein